MGSSPENNKFVPMRRSFLLLYASAIFILLAFVVSDVWFSRQVAGLSEAVNIAGSERMRIYKIASLIDHASYEVSPGREATVGQVREEMARFEEILAALKNGSRPYRVKKIQDPAIAAVLQRLIDVWGEVIKPQFNASLSASTGGDERFLNQDEHHTRSMVEKEVNELIRLLIGKMNQAEHIFLGLQHTLTLLGCLLMGLNLVYLRRRILQPIQVLMHDTEQMTAGNLAVRAKVSTNNEFMLLAERFNAMAAAISNSFATMEATIRQRGDELIAANRKRQEFADHLRLLMDSTGEGIYGLDRTGCCTFINRAGAAMVGYTPEELLGKNMHEVIHHSRPDGSPYPMAECPIFRAFRTGAAARIDNEWLWRKDRSSLPVEYASYPIIIDGEIGGAVITFNDISEIIAARLERDKLINAVEQSEDSIIITDLNGVIEYVNPAFERKTGYGAAEALGKNPRILKSGKQSREFYATMWQTLTRGEIWRGELINKKKTGELYYEQVTISPVKNDKREITHYVAIKNDTTARKLAEEEILRKNRELELLTKRQAAMMQELQTAMHAAEGAVRAKSDFLANMSHEIRTPMNAILGIAHLLATTTLTPQQLDYVAKIDSAAKGLLGIINDILDFSKIEAGKLALESVPFNLDEVMRELANMTVAKAQEKGMELLFSLSPEVPMELIGDPLRLGQVLINLTGNAIKFTKQGEVIVQVEVVEKQAASVRLRFSIRDTGIGMTDTQQERLFQAFSQADTSTTREYGGTGLGLTISKQLVEMMGGEIGVASEYGKGSTFFFTAGFACHVAHKSCLLHDGGFKDMPALVVDDNPTARGILEVVLQGMGFVVTVARSGHEALEIVTKAEPAIELVMMDWCLPDLGNGLEVSKRIKAHPHLALIPTIIMVTCHNLQDISGQVHAVCDGLLEKPFTASDIFNTIMSAMGKGGRDQSESPQPRTYSERVKQIRGARVLLVEDNEINQQVAREILEGAGVVVVIAPNGKEAVAMAAQGGYDLILMDIQMPVMDGLTAAAAIRRLPAAEAQTLPIIAMTAHAMSGDREKSLAAGMDDHITKPIDPDQLFATLLKYLKPGRRLVPSRAGAVLQTAQEEGGLPPGPTAARASARIERHERRSVVTDRRRYSSDRRNAYNEQALGHGTDLPTWLPGLDIRGGVTRLTGNQALYLKLLKQFSEENEDVLAAIVEAQRVGDLTTARRLVHTVKGTAGNINAIGLQKAADELEKASNDSVGNLEDFLEKFRQALAEVKGSIATLLAMMKTSAADEGVAPNGQQDLSKVFDDLAALLARNDFKVVQLWQNYRPLLSRHCDAHAITELEKLIERFNFPAAQELLARIAAN